MKAVFALVDCNNFFASCERLFRPDLADRPVVVLSSNDGCVVARSNQAKQLGIPMGAPAFKYAQLFRQHGVVQFSANFELYADLSKRVARLLTSYSPQIEVYSIDESFLDISQLEIEDYGAWGRQICRQIQRQIGLPVSIGIAPTKTLAKLASEQAKHNPLWRGACDMYGLSAAGQADLLKDTPVQSVWGIGRQLGKKLRAEGIFDALALSKISDALSRQLTGSINGSQVTAELNGISCHPIKLQHARQKSIMRGRTFGEDTGDYEVIEAAIASLSARAAHCLRQEAGLAKSAGLLIENNRHKPGYRRWWLPISFDMPTADSGEIINQLAKVFRQAYRPGQAYHRANVILFDIVGSNQLQTDLLGLVDPAKAETNKNRMLAVDAINGRYGKNQIHYASENLSSSWQPKRQLRSPLYLSRWDELPECSILSSDEHR